MLRAVCSPLFFALAALAFLLAGMECVWPGFFLHDDNASWFAGAYAHDFRTLTQSGELAEVNFYQYGGEPFVEQGQTAVLYPLVYVAGALASLWPGDLRATVDWLAAIHLALAVAGFYAWLRRGGADARVAALGGLVWALNPFVLLLGASWIMVTAAAAWLPWLFWAVDGALAVERGPQKKVRGPSTALGSAALDKGGLPPRSAQDDGFLKSGLRRGLPLGLIAGLFVLQGYVQWAAYAFLFAGMYAAFQVFAAKERMRALVALGIAGLIAAAVAMPQVLPLLHGAAESKTRAEALSPMFELFYRVEPGDLLAAQVGFFREHFLFGASTALLFCPALILLPVALIAFVRGDEAVRRRLFPLIVLAMFALFFSGRGYFLLNVVPFMAKFRWPFKVFLFAEFFLVAGVVWACGRQSQGDESASAGEQKKVRGPSTALGSTAMGKGVLSPRSAQDDGFLKSGLRRLGVPLLVVVIVLQVAVALAVHERNFLSAAGLPMREAALPWEMNPMRGRVIAAGDVLPITDAYRLYTHAYATFFEVPSIGGYNPLVSRDALAFSQGMDVPNFYNLPITPEVLAGFEDQAVRYWIVAADSPQQAQLEKMPGMKFLGAGLAAKPDPLGSKKPPIHEISNILLYISRGDRAIYEDMGASPLAFDEKQPQTSLPVRYVGNSMLIQLSGSAGTIGVSVGPSDGWWYRVDGAAWKQSSYKDYRLQVAVGAGSHELEVRYFDSRLRTGLCISLIISFLLGLGYLLLPGLRARYG
jgi:hypothetical protein